MKNSSLNKSNFLDNFVHESSFVVYKRWLWLLSSHVFFNYLLSSLHSCGIDLCFERKKWKEMFLLNFYSQTKKGCSIMLLHATTWLNWLWNISFISFIDTFETGFLRKTTGKRNTHSNKITIIKIAFSCYLLRDLIMLKFLSHCYATAWQKFL